MNATPTTQPSLAVELFGGPFDGQVIVVPGPPESISLLENKVRQCGTRPVIVAHCYRRRSAEGITLRSRSGAYAMDWCRDLD